MPVDAVPSPLSLAPGTYTISERRPSSPDGTWRLVKVRCNGETITSRPVRVEVHSGQGSVCTFVNAFTPRGSISLAKVTFGATGTTTFLINPNRPPLAQFLQHATTTQQGVPVDAKPASAADATDHLRLGSYTIVEQAPPALEAGHWTLSSVVCNGVVEPFDQGAVTVRLTRTEPSVHCQFANVFSPKPPPDPFPVVPSTPPVNPPGGGASPEPVYPITDLDVSKQASPSTVMLGQVVTYRVTVRNVSHVTAQRVVVSDQTVVRGMVLSIHNPAGACRIHPRAICQLGNLKPGAKVVITARVIPQVIAHALCQPGRGRQRYRRDEPDQQHGPGNGQGTPAAPASFRPRITRRSGGLDAQGRREQAPLVASVHGFEHHWSTNRPPSGRRSGLTCQP